MSTTQTLLPNTLYIALWILDDPSPSNNFHWALYHHHSPSSGGMRYEIRNVGPVGSLGGGWIPEHAWCSNILKTSFLCVLVQIATLPTGSADAGGEGRLDRTVSVLDDRLNHVPGVTCRVWLVLVLERLAQEGLVEFVGGDLKLLEKECMDFGNRARFEAAVNRQPRPVVVSRVCV